ARYRYGHRRGQRLEVLACAACGGHSHAFDKCHSICERKRPRPRGVQVAAHCPRPFVMMRVRRKTAIGEVDATTIEELAVGRNSDEYRRVTVLRNADGRCSLRSSFLHVFLLRRLRPFGWCRWLLSSE